MEIKMRKNKRKEKQVFQLELVFISNKGHIITDYHVVQNKKNIKFLFNNDEISAKLISFDHQLDLALLKSKLRTKFY